MASRTVRWLRSAIAIALALLAIPAVNLAGSWLSARLGLPAGGDLRLAVDLLWVCTAGVVGSFLAARVAPSGKAGHAWAVFAIYLATDLHAVLTMGSGFPIWFGAGVIGLLPLQVWLGWRLAGGARDAPPPRAGRRQDPGERNGQ